MRIVIRIGGSVIASPINPTLISEYANLLRKLAHQRHKLAIVVGGGKLAREFIALGKQLKFNQEAQDRIAISVSRLFAQTIMETLGEICCSTIPITAEQADECLKHGDLVIMGGFTPGMTTDTVAALVAEKIKADLLIKASNQDGLYDKDPARYPKAKKLDQITIDELASVLEKSEHEAGIHQIIDPEAVKVLRRAKILVTVLNGFDPDNVLKVISGELIGTKITFATETTEV